jgi:hypothetical protein
MVRRPTGAALAAEPTLTDAQAQVLNAVADEIHRWSAQLGGAVTVRWHDELTLRRRLVGLWPDTNASATGGCRIMRASDDWFAISVSRPWDHDVLPALVESPVDADHWATLRRWATVRTAQEVVARARLFDMAAAIDGSMPTRTPVPLGMARRWPAVAVQPLDRLRVVDLSSLWAGPLVARLLRDGGSVVTKVESAARPDGARDLPAFYRHMHRVDQPVVVLDLASAGGRNELYELIQGADVVIESSRPRALRQLGAGPDQVGPRPGRVWLSITGYGRGGRGGNWVAFGDDAAVAGGLTARTSTGGPVFLSDAVADPVTGLFGAAAVLRSLAQGGGHLIDLPLAGAAAAVARGEGGLGSRGGWAGAPEQTWPS